MKTHDEMVAEWMKDPEFKIEYNSLEEEFALLDEVLKYTRRPIGKAMAKRLAAVLGASHKRFL